MKYLAVLMSVAFLVACNKSNGDKTKPFIVLNSPSANQQFTQFSNVVISGTVTDDKLIYDVHVIVTNLSNMSEVLNVQDTVNTQNYNINEVFNVTVAATYKIHVEADDVSGNTSVVEIQVKGN